MSGIFGIVNLDGQPVARERLEAMRNSMAYWGPDGGPFGRTIISARAFVALQYARSAIRSPAAPAFCSGVVLAAHGGLITGKKSFQI